jgi:ParB family transcriptional regulator, chromosome partitioning protein
MSVSSSPGPLHDLKDIPVDQIDPNPNNPRLIFPPEELDRLAESIASEGILVPVVVFARDGRYVLIDGERRYRCTLTLGLETVPANITTERTDLENLLQMFNIHLVREPWRDMPTA